MPNGTASAVCRIGNGFTWASTNVRPASGPVVAVTARSVP